MEYTTNGDMVIGKRYDGKTLTINVYDHGTRYVIAKMNEFADESKGQK